MALSPNALRRAIPKGRGVQGPRPVVPAPKSNAPAATTPAAPKVGKAEKYAQQDPDYRRAVAAYRANLANTQAQNATNRANLDADHQTTVSRLNSQFATDNSNQQADFANRGMFGSGVFAKAYSDQLQNQNNQRNDEQSSYQRNADQLATDTSNATQLELQQESAAKAAAIRRAAAQYGLTGKAGTKKKPTPIKKKK